MVPLNRALQDRTMQVILLGSVHAGGYCIIAYGVSNGICRQKQPMQNKHANSSWSIEFIYNRILVISNKNISINLSAYSQSLVLVVTISRFCLFLVGPPSPFAHQPSMLSIPPVFLFAPASSQRSQITSNLRISNLPQVPWNSVNHLSISQSYPIRVHY